MAEGRLIPHHGEAILLRTWPFHEADLLVSLFSREHGKVKGVARHAMKSRKRFGGALESGTHVRAHYTERPRQDLVRMDSLEILWSPLTAPVDWLRAAGMQLIVEVLEEALPELAPEDNVFRLAIAVLREMQGTGTKEQRLERDQGPENREHRSQNSDKNTVWLAVTYFCLWMNRLLGWMPELGHCAVCGLDLRGEPVWWSPVADGVTCSSDRKSQSQWLSAKAVEEAQRRLRMSLQELQCEDWPQARAADLRDFMIGVLERHLESRLLSATALRMNHPHVQAQRR